MNRFARAALLTITLCTPAFAQDITGGTYKVTQMDGSPVRPGVEVSTVLIPPIYGGPWIGLVFMKTGEEFVPVEAENFVMVVDERGVGHWQNVRRTQGHIEPRADGTLKSTVDTGTSAGTERLMSK